MKTLFVTDLDGTLLNDKAELTEISKGLLSESVKRGVSFTVATARTFATVKQMFKGVDLRLPLILMNGVMLYEPKTDKILSCRSIGNDTAEKVFDIYRKHNIFPLVYRSKDCRLEIEYYDTENPYQMKYIGKRNETDGKKFIFSPSFDLCGKSEIIYIVTLDKYEKILPLYEEIKNTENISCVFYSDNYTDCYFLEIFAENTSKASAFLEVKRIINADRTVAFGDNLNDMEMFHVSDEAYAVENACDALKEISTAVIGRNEDNSVAKFIYKCSESINEII